MRVLRYVGPGEDDRHLLVEAIDDSAQFSLLITDDLRHAAGTDLPRLGNPRIRESPISPREIQVRVRAGESPEDIAEQADLPLDRVMRFAGAVVQERLRITSEARNARARRNSADGDMVVFGDHVDSRFAAHGIEPGSVTWNAYRGEDGQWIISAGWHGGDLNRVARWSLALATRTVSPMDETAGDLLSDRPIRPVVHVVYDLPIANPSDAETGPIPTAEPREEVFDQDASFGRRLYGAETFGSVAPLARASATRTGAHQLEGGESFNNGPRPVNPVGNFGEGPSGEPVSNAASTVLTSAFAIAPLRLAEPLPGMPAHQAPYESYETDEERAERAHIPSWDDILLGVRRKND